MFRAVKRTGFFLIGCFAALCSPLTAETGHLITPGLHLQCSISFSNYDHIDYSIKTVEVSLTNVKHKPGGMHMLTQTQKYEFWVMTHGVQSLNGRWFINNFQVAIKHKPSNLFMHALSDTIHQPGIYPQHARISLVQYYPDSFLEKGELCFECLRLD